MKKIFIGLLFLFFRITINSVDILPNFVGYVLIYLGLAEVIQTPSVETSRMLSAAAAVVEGVLWVLALFGVGLGLPLGLLFQVLITWRLVTWAGETENPRAGQFRVSWYFLAAGAALSLALAWLEQDLALYPHHRRCARGGQQNKLRPHPQGHQDRPGGRGGGLPLRGGRAPHRRRGHPRHQQGHASGGRSHRRAELSRVRFDTGGAPRPGPGRRPRLGDMVISMEHVSAQAREYAHPKRRELAYLVVHSALHLLGYDHLDEGPMKARMRAREEAILAELGITREKNA